MPFDAAHGEGGPGGPSKDDIAAVAFFISGAETDGAMYQGRRAADVFDAFSRILGVPAGELRSAIRDAEKDRKE